MTQFPRFSFHCFSRALTRFMFAATTGCGEVLSPLPEHCPTDAAAFPACRAFEFPGLFSAMISSEIAFSQGNLKCQLDGMEVHLDFESEKTPY